MSDFAGIWRLDGRPIDDADLSRLGTAMDGKLLGPPRVWRSHEFAVVHRQSAFSPREKFERQPLVTPSGATFAADLRLVARDDLIRALDLPSEASEWSDGALLARALDAWPLEDALSRLYDEYAFALWRPEERRLVLGRDILGRRSLFVHRSAGLIAFSTRMRPLLSLPDVPQDLDEEVIADQLIINIGDDRRTIYRAIDRHPPAHFAVHSPEAARLSAYWDLPEPGSLRIPARDLDAAARDVLDQAVADALDCEGPPTVFLTAGLDTANVAVAAARLVAPGRLAAATLVPGGKIPSATQWRFHDESPRAAALAALHPNIDWTVVKGDDGAAWVDHDSRGHFVFFGAPARAPVNRAFFQPLVRFLEARGARVTLGGEMGNGFFSYDGVALLPQLFAQGRWIELFGHCRALHANGWTARSLTAQVLRPFAPIAFMQWRHGRSRKGPLWARHSPINPAFAEEIRLAERIDPRFYKLRGGIPIHLAREERRWMLRDPLPFDNMNAGRARLGLDHRPPLADRRVIEFFGALPLEEFLRGGQVRSIAKRLLRGAAPEETIRLESNGLQGGDWFQWMTAARPRMQDELPRLRASPLARRIVDLDRLQALLDEWPTDADAAEKRRPEYLQKLSSGLEMARFLAWSEGSNQ